MMRDIPYGNKSYYCLECKYQLYPIINFLLLMNCHNIAIQKNFPQKYLIPKETEKMHLFSIF